MESQVSKSDNHVDQVLSHCAGRNDAKGLLALQAVQFASCTSPQFNCLESLELEHQLLSVLPKRLLTNGAKVGRHELQCLFQRLAGS